MKKNLIKKVFAVSLSIAMACSLLPASKPVTASAAAPYVSLKTTFKTLKINQNYKMTLKNNSLNWKIKKVGTTDKTIATVHSKTASSVMIKGKSEGRATISVSLKTSARKKKNTKTVKCRVKVVKETETPVVQTEATVKTQAELKEALANSNITKITIKPDTAENFVIDEANYSAVDLIVDAPQSDIENSAQFKSITINNIKPESWTEKGKGNTITVASAKVRIVVAQGASIAKIVLSAATDAKVELNGGAVAEIAVNAKSTLNMTGKAAENAALVKIIIGAAAAESNITTAVPAAVETNAKVTLVFKSGAEGSTVKLAVAGISAAISNETKNPVTVTKNDNTQQTVPAGAVNQTVNAVGTTTNPGGSTSNPSGTPVGKPATPVKIVTTSALTLSGTAEVTDVTTGAIKDVMYVSAGSLKGLTGVCAVTTTGGSVTDRQNAKIQVSISLRNKDKGILKTILGWTDVEEVAGKDIDLKGVIADANYAYELVLSYRVKENSDYAVGGITKYVASIGAIATTGGDISGTAKYEK